MKNEQSAFVSTKRSTDLIASFIDGFADGWFMAVKDCFQMELDIVLTERKKAKSSYLEWTQGPYYCFSEGQIIFDVKEGYMCWQDALNKVNVACQIVAAKPNMPIKIDNEITGKSEYRVLEGFVRFVLFKPDEGRTKLIPDICYHLSQNNFVQYLKTGKL